MGSADVVPGVSGGTMAFILGIYEELVMSIRAGARAPFWRALLRLDIRAALTAVNAPFLLAVLAGIAVAILTLASGLEWLLENRPVMIWSFFFGLVLASIVTVRKRILRWTPALYAALIAGAVGAYFLVGAVPVQTPETAWFLFLSGMPSGHLRHDPAGHFRLLHSGASSAWANTSLCWPRSISATLSASAFSASARSSAS